MAEHEFEQSLGFYGLFFDGMPLRKVLPELLADKSTGKNIVWATSNYEKYGAHYRMNRQMLPDMCMNLIMGGLLLPRVEKSKELQEQRTKDRAEVFTPSWIVNKMNNFCDEQWFMRKDVFNTENEDDHTWTTNSDLIGFETRRDAHKRSGWQQYVDSRRCEITCGEAPYMVSRYDATTGDVIPIQNRIGFLDRKLRAVNENAKNQREWLDWTYRAYQASYGYEYQGDNLFLARVNLVQTFIEYYQAKWDKEPRLDTIRKIVDIVTWNAWQMDGLKDTVPCGKPIDGFIPSDDAEKEASEVLCRIKDWRANRTLTFHSMKGGKQ